MEQEFKINSFNKSRNTLVWVFVVVALGVLGGITYLYFNNSDKKPDAAQPTEISEQRATTPAAPRESPDVGNYDFDDGLRNADSVTRYTLDDFGAGVASREVFNIDINNDNRKDRITRTRVENGTDHFSIQYTIELNTVNGFTDITPDNFKTIEGAECSLQKFRFVFRPEFSITKISRTWSESWDTPTRAVRNVYTLAGGELRTSAPQQLKTVCNVSDLF